MENQNTLREIREARAMGMQLIASLEKALESLDSAKGWGMFDMFGGGLLATAFKHSKIDDTKVELENTRRLLERYKAELLDVGELFGDVSLELGDFATFADYFFDGLLADWWVQSKLSECRDRAKALLTDVRGSMDRLISLEARLSPP